MMPRAVSRLEADPARPWDAQCLGEQARLAGDKLSALPFKIRDNPELSAAWRRGWRAAARKIRRATSQRETTMVKGKANGTAMPDPKDAQRDAVAGEAAALHTAPVNGVEAQSGVETTPETDEQLDDKLLSELRSAFERSVLGLRAETLSGDLRDTILATLQGMVRPWNKMSEAAQKSGIRTITEKAVEMVERIARAVAASEGASVMGQLDKVGLGKNLELKVLVPRSSAGRHDLLDAQGGEVLISIPNVSRFLGERMPARATPDAPELPLDRAKEVEAARLQ
jgi:hypothetical protein